jgi:hypothetical protein
LVNNVASGDVFLSVMFNGLSSLVDRSFGTAGQSVVGTGKSAETEHIPKRRNFPLNSRAIAQNDRVGVTGNKW